MDSELESGRSDGRERGDGALRTLLAWAAFLLAARWVARRLATLPSLEGDVALVTGGSRGLGYLLAERLLEQGCDVAICARDAGDLERARARLARTHGRDVLTWRCDVSDARAVEEMIWGIEERLGPIDILVNNASVIEVAPLAAFDRQAFRRAIDIDYMGTVHTTLAVLPGMRARRYGRICNITSIGGKVAVPHLLPYDAAKFAAVGFSEGLRAEVARDGVSVTTVVPGLMRTGSPTRVEYGGKPEREYVWFTLGDLLPVSAMSAERAADRIVLALRRGESEVVLSWQAKALRVAHEVAPGAVTRVLGWVSRLLPGAGSRHAHGTELRGALPEVAERALDRAAERTNQGLSDA
ncbi:MAG TPA: SDR family oxidoreductase [Longimicrobiales bacterium]|nr:SDR family oxidoreductase [Longimicrobiales bacterium]